MYARRRAATNSGGSLARPPGQSHEIRVFVIPSGARNLGKEEAFGFRNIFAALENDRLGLPLASITRNRLPDQQRFFRESFEQFLQRLRRRLPTHHRFVRELWPEAKQIAREQFIRQLTARARAV